MSVAIVVPVVIHAINYPIMQLLEDDNYRTLLDMMVVVSFIAIILSTQKSKYCKKRPNFKTSFNTVMDAMTWWLMAYIIVLLCGMLFKVFAENTDTNNFLYNTSVWTVAYIVAYYVLTLFGKRDLRTACDNFGDPMTGGMFVCSIFLAIFSFIISK